MTCSPDVSLSSYAEASHWHILVFFPKAWSFICPTEIKAFNARLEEFLYSRQCAVVFVSTDNEHCLKAWNSTSEMEGGLGGVHVPLLSDMNHRLSRDYGVLNEDEGVAQRALFIIDPKSKIRNITVNDADVGRSVDEAKRILDALIFKDEFGEGCPIDWKKGDKGIDVASKTKIEGELEIVPKKSWLEWARPKLQRAWSHTSQMSSASAVTAPAPRSIAGYGYDSRDRSHSNLASGSHSPLVSPGMKLNGVSTFESQLDDTINAQKNMQSAMGEPRRLSLYAENKADIDLAENMQAAMHNQSIGVAN